jgi:hypothetical protein
MSPFPYGLAGVIEAVFKPMAFMSEFLDHM